MEKAKWLLDVVGQVQAVLNNPIEQNYDSEEEKELLTEISLQLTNIQDRLNEALYPPKPANPIIPWLATVKGLGPVLTERIINSITNIEDFDDITKFWEFAGFDINDKSVVSAELKDAIYKMGICMLQSDSPYVQVYHQTKQYHTEHNTNKYKIHLLALTSMEKVFLYHLWFIWRKELGLPTVSTNPQTRLTCQMMDITYPVKRFTEEYFCEKTA